MSESRRKRAWGKERIVGVRCREQRTRLGLTQQQVARRMGHEHAFVSNIEHGKVRVDLALLCDLARALQHVSIAWLLGEQLHPYNPHAEPEGGW